MRLVALDPGGTTGVCEYDGSGFFAHQIEQNPHHASLFHYLTHFAPDEVICEEFVYQIRNQDKYAAAAVNLISREYIGVAELYTQTIGVPLHRQMPSDMKFWDDGKLKKMGLYKAGAPHACDATRHMLQFLVFKKGRRDLLNALRP